MAEHDRGDLIFRLEGDHSEVLVFAEFMQDLARRSDGVTPVKEIELRFLRTGDQSKRCALVTGDAAVRPLGHRRGLHLETHGEGFAGLAVVVPGHQRSPIRLQHFGLLTEFAIEECFGERILPAVHPVDETEYEHVLAAILLLHTEGGVLECGACKFRDIHAV